MTDKWKILQNLTGWEQKANGMAGPWRKWVLPGLYGVAVAVDTHALIAWSGAGPQALGILGALAAGVLAFQFPFPGIWAALALVALPLLHTSVLYTTSLLGVAVVLLWLSQFGLSREGWLRWGTVALLWPWLARMGLWPVGLLILPFFGSTVFTLLLFLFLVLVGTAVLPFFPLPHGAEVFLHPSPGNFWQIYPPHSVAVVATSLQAWWQRNQPGVLPFLYLLVESVLLLSIIRMLRNRIPSPLPAMGVAALLGAAMPVVVPVPLGPRNPLLWLADLVVAYAFVLSMGRPPKPAPLTRQRIGGISPEEESSSVATPTELPKVDWDTVAGYEDLKREIDELLEPFLDPRIRERLEQARIPLPKGILLYGPPGTGKTLIAKAIATRLNRPFFHVAGAQLLSQWVGGSEAEMMRVFQSAREQKPSVIFFDEVEALLPNRQNLSPSTGVGQVSANVVGIFLSQMDGVIPLDDVLVVAATNHPKQVDPAALRPGRFDKILYIAPPDPTARRAIFLSHLQGRPGAEAIDVDALVEVSARYTGADIAAAINGAYRANRGAPVTTEQLVTVLTINKPTVTLSMLKEYEALRDEYSRTDHLVEARAVATPTRYTWNDIGGLKQVKEDLRRMVEQPLLHPDLYKTYGVRPPRGILLYGPPGCGKTHMARVLASICEANFYPVKGPELLSKWIGESESAIRNLFQRARENAPAIIFFDEIDTLAENRETADNRVGVVTQLLTEMDGLEPLERVLVLAATNRIDSMDPALRRAGRFEHHLEIPLPDAAGRRELFAIALKGKPGGESVDLDVLVAATAGRNGADIVGYVEQAASRVISEVITCGGDPRPLETGDILSVVERVGTIS